uniref:J domain-containing protein n=2 Tax=Timspurckia oligopyrenoides TaxID=708627 RepID=A0A7S0ZH52_9RHOD
MGGEEEFGMENVYVKDPRLYELLGVEVGTSSESKLKKAYYRKARDCHPDKNLDDKDATERFQQLGEAYQILNNGESRELYNKLGYNAYKKRHASGGDMVDPTVLFTMLFGSERFKDYFGTLRLAAHVSEESDENGEDSAQDEKEKAKADEEAQLAREQELTLKLISKVGVWVDGSHRQFSEWAQKEAEELLETPFGGPMLVVLGTMYREQAEIYLGRQSMMGFGGVASSFRHSTGIFGSQIRTTVSAIQAMRRQEQLQAYMQRTSESDDPEEPNSAEHRETSGVDSPNTDSVENPTKREEDAAHVAVKTLIDMLELVWQVTAMDIQATSDSVSKTVLSGNDLGEASEQDLRDARLPLVDFFQQHIRGTNESQNASTAPAGWGGMWSAVQASWNGPPKLGEGQKAQRRVDILNARACALKEMGDIFVRVGQKKDVKDELLNALGIDKKEAEEIENKIIELEKQERIRQREEKKKQQAQKHSAKIAATSV